jgi:hypothetical protein
MAFDYKGLDEQRRFSYRADKMAIAQSLGYSFITEMVHKLYLVYSNLREVAEIVGVTGDNVRQILHYIGATLNKRGKARVKVDA